MDTPANTKQQFVNEYLANERTLLAWIRTAIGIMAFGFVVVKFSLFVRQLTIVLGKPNMTPKHPLSEPMGIALVVLGAITMLYGSWRYRSTERQLKSATVVVCVAE